MKIAIQHQTGTLETKVSQEHTEEQKLVSGLIVRNRAIQKEVYKKYFGKMLGVTMRYTSNREDAYEILNDAFMKVFDSIGNYKGTGSLSGWIYRIVQYTTYAYVRKKYKYKVIHEEVKPHLITVDNDALSNMGLEVIYEMIQKLPDSQRTVFSMFVFDGLKHQEIADQLGITRGTSKWYLAKARIRLQELLKNY